MNRPLHVLVIDDEEIVLLSVERTLTKEGYSVDKASSAKEAIEKIKTESYDVIITDLMMPEVNGIELLQILSENNISIPSIMITGYPTIKTAIEALRLGAVDYVPKPFTRQELLSPLSRALHRESGEQNKPVKRISFYDADESYEDSIEAGDEFLLPGHSWCRHDDDEKVTIGIEDSFLITVGVEDIEVIDIPQENDLIEQGHSSLKITTRSGREHQVYMPLSGRVIASNSEANDSIKRGDLDTWVIRIEPAKLDEEIHLLKKKG